MLLYISIFFSSFKLNKIFQLDEADMLDYTDSLPMLDFTVMTNTYRKIATPIAYQGFN